MHDPLTVAFSVKIPLFFLRASTFRKDQRKEWQFYHLATIWHKDPEKRGSDDSCGWFKRAHHGDQKVLEKIEKRFEYDWDRTFKSESGSQYDCGYFHPNGSPNLSVTAVVLNLFFLAACEYFNRDGRTNWNKPRRWMQKHLFDIMLFAENTCDSMFDGITMKFGSDWTGDAFKDAHRRKERIHGMASTIYGWILREEQPWYRHPRWHVHHWRLQVPFLQQLWRWLFVRCAKCRKGFRFGEGAIGSWSGKSIWHDHCDSHNVSKEQP